MFIKAAAVWKNDPRYDEKTNSWSIRLSIVRYLVLSSQWSEHPLSVWPLWMRAGVIGARAAPKGLRVSNMIQQSVLDSLVAAAYILIISREPERCGGSGGLRHHQRYHSPAFQHRGDAGPFWGHVWHNGFCLTLSVTVSYPNSAKGAPCLVCRASLAQFCLFDSLEPDSNSEFGCYLKADASLVRKASRTTSEAGEAPLCAFESLLPTRKSVLFRHTIHSVHWKYSDLSFSNQWHQFQWTIVYSAAAEQKGLCALCSQLNVYMTQKHHHLVFGRSKVKFPLESGT